MTVTVDVSRASEVTQGSVPIPRVRTFDQLLAFPMDVWLDDQHIRRVRFETEKRTQTVEFSDFGVSLDDLMWNRLPTLRSPEEAAWVAAGKRPSTLQRARRRLTRGG